MNTIWTINLFYPLLFLTIIVAFVIIGIVLIKAKDNSLFGNIFDKHADEHIDTTDKFAKAHTEVIALPKQYEDELHSLEVSVRDTNQRILDLTNDINKKIDVLIERIAKLEKK